MTPTAFWNWFAQNAARLRLLDGKALVDEVYDKVSEVDERLGIEVSADPADDKPRELIITAYALREAMPAALSLASEAPPLPGWIIIGLRPPKGFGFSFKNDDGGFEGKDLHFVRMSKHPAPIRLRLVIPAPIDELPAEGREQLGWQIVNIGLGELLAARIDELEVIAGDEGEPIEDLAGWLSSTIN